LVGGAGDWGSAEALPTEESCCSSSITARDSKEPLLLERRVRNVFDRNGRCWQRITQCRPVAPTEYDAHCAAVAATGRPLSLRRSLGDWRAGAQLLEGAAADRRVTLARLRGSRRGREFLGQLAAEVRRRFRSRLQVAGMVKYDAGEEGSQEGREW
jgi:hypothetical protein